MDKKVTMGHCTLECKECSVVLEERPVQPTTLGMRIFFPGGSHLKTCKLYKKYYETTLRIFPPEGESKLVCSGRFYLLCG